jgi:hypothetical protein
LRDISVGTVAPIVGMKPDGAIWLLAWRLMSFHAVRSWALVSETLSFAIDCVEALDMA